MTVYLVQKSTVYRQVYRHNAVDLAGFDETIIDSRFSKTELLQRVIAVLRRAEHPLHVPRNYVESGCKRLPHIDGVAKNDQYTVKNTVT